MHPKSNTAYIAFDLPQDVDPDSWARALLGAVEHEIAVGARQQNDRPKVYISSQSTLGPGHAPQVIAEPSAYGAMLSFDMRDFEAYELEKRELPTDAVEVTALDLRPGRVFGFPEGLWRVSPSEPGDIAIEFTNVDTSQRKVFVLSVGEFADLNSHTKLYPYEWYRFFREAIPG
jgi:hypothetical protein